MNNDYNPEENALTVLSRISFDELIEQIANKVAQQTALRLGENGDLSGIGHSNFLNAKEVAELIGVSLRTLDTLVDRGEVPPPVLGGGHGSTRLWNPKDLEVLRSAS